LRTLSGRSRVEIRRGRGYAVIEKLDRVVARIVKRLDPRAEAT
jgi:hypothetical protein